jgi:hypothetical protein
VASADKCLSLNLAIFCQEGNYDEKLSHRWCEIPLGGSGKGIYNTLPSNVRMLFYAMLFYVYVYESPYCIMYNACLLTWEEIYKPQTNNWPHFLSTELTLPRKCFKVDFLTI